MSTTLTWTAPLTLTPNGVFVFGSNLAGRHGKGASQTALKQFGAIYGQGNGLQGRSYALPTMSANAPPRPAIVRPLPLAEIARHADVFKAFAAEHQELFFFLTRVGCGSAGFTDRQIAPLFLNAPANVLRPPEWGRDVARNQDSDRA